MISAAGTDFARNLLESVRTGINGWALERIRQNPSGHRQEMAKDHLQHNYNKQRLLELIKATQTRIPVELQKRMRSGKIAVDERRNLLYEIGVTLMLEVLASRGISAQKTRSFMKQKPLVLRYLYLKAWRCMTWIEKGGIESLSDKAVTNEEIDDQYVLSATMFQGLNSEENSVNTAYQDILHVLAKKV